MSSKKSNLKAVVKTAKKRTLAEIGSSQSRD